MGLTEIIREKFQHPRLNEDDHGDGIDRGYDRVLDQFMPGKSPGCLFGPGHTNDALVEEDEAQYIAGLVAKDHSGKKKFPGDQS